MAYYITTDATCDLPKDFQRDKFFIVPMSYMMDGEEYGIDKFLESKEFYDKMRNGSMPTTSLITTYTIKEVLTPYLKQGFDILHICFASALSSSYQNAKIAESELREEFPDRKIYVIDSKCACTGEGLLVQLALDARDKGMDIDENYEYTLDNIKHLCHYFTPNDLFHLQRGGRVSKTAAIAGTLLNIKPVLYCNKDGKLIPIAKVKGRKKALLSLVDNMLEKMYPAEENKIVYISHADCIEDAEFVKEKVIEKTGVTNVIITNIGPVIGTHAGAGTIALFFLGNDRISEHDETLK